MTMKLDSEEIINIMSVYAPQTGCEDEEKDTFWNELKQEIDSIPREERVIIGGDLNGHVGRKGNETRGLVHGGWSVGVENEEGRRILDFALASDMALCNTFFEKQDKHLITYRSEGVTSQIDFILYRRPIIKEEANCKVINKENVATQHKLLVMDCSIDVTGRKKKRKVCTPNIKWWLLKTPENCEIFKRKVMEKAKRIEGVNQWWEENSKVIKEEAVNVLGKTSGKGAPNDKESWWWNAEVQKAIKEKKETKKKYDKTKTQQDKEAYITAKKEAKRMVPRAKAKKLSEATEDQDSIEGKRKLLRIAKERDKASKDFTHVKQIKSVVGTVIRKDGKNIFEKLLNEENERTMFEDGTANQGMTEAISREKVVQAMKKMNEEWESNRTRLDTRGGVEVFGRVRGGYVM
ncbi:hypothetical protein M8J77_018083 [Diaphorina citri]|nr:hypothetical protein M8J77_018083 [Diaphorina citri]